MKFSRTIAQFILVILLSSAVVSILLPARPARAFGNNCGLDPSNLFRNGSMAPGHDTAFGVVSSEWEPFIVGATPPLFEWVDNEKWDANGAQYFWSDATPFDAGIRQTVGNLQPGMYYRFRIGYSHARLDPGNAKNEVSPHMGRQVGVDALGGTDPRAPSVSWGPQVFNSGAGMNLPELTMTFAARSDKATIYFRGINKATSGRGKVWFDVACMEPVPDMPTATPAAPTATPVPPTATARPTQQARVASPTPTRIPATRTPTRTATPIAAAVAPTATPGAVVPAAVNVSTEAELPTPVLRSARPLEPATSAPFELDGASVLTMLGASSVFGSFLFFGVGLILFRQWK